MKSISGGAGAGFLAEAKVNAADYFPLLVEIFQRGLHLAVEQHPAVDLEALFPVEIFRFADGWDRSGEITLDFVANFAALVDLADCEAWFFETVVGDGVGAP